MLPEKIRLRIYLPQLLGTQLRQDAETNGHSISGQVTAYIQQAMLGNAAHTTAAHTTDKEGSIEELCDLVHNFLQSLYMFRGELGEEERGELLCFIKNAMQDYTRVRQILQRYDDEQNDEQCTVPR